ncbi:PREDICTED: ARL14 effector protein-like isoform X1 [Branchiostoma belcheri]|uniref:ARL14 effector protein-like isoform X1 n=1 Tax=Branchiostoma belcheri TaxID=7741 RepID=A0A6P4Z323_BRABE|nr:PREDICTED: ARL14 effector protein-like isoform X1 [Branchiostoma belcheri]
MADDLKKGESEKPAEEERPTMTEEVLDESGKVEACMPHSNAMAGVRKFKSHPTLERTLQHLQFRNPGPMLQDFDPEKSEREKRKLTRMVQQQKQKAKSSQRDKHKKRYVYDEAGVLISDGRDLCDCLEQDCPGCHYPCPKCGSEKCGAECRCNRKWHYEWIESECRQTRRTFKQV